MSRPKREKKKAKARPKSTWLLFKEKMFVSEADISLSIFRMCFGIVLLVSTVKLWNNLELNYLDQFFAYKYQGFEWVRLMDENILRFILGIMAATSIMLSFGILIRISSIVYTIGYSYFFLLDASYYNNHYYVIILLGILFFVTGGGRSFSISSLFTRDSIIQQSQKWETWIFQVQVFIIYFFGGLTKLNFDWLSGGTMECILRSGVDFNDKGAFFQTDTAVYLYTWAGLIFDLVIGFMLFWRPTRFVSLIAIIAFNCMNAAFFKIGVFPFMMMGASILFFDKKDFERLASLFGKSWFIVAEKSSMVQPKKWVLTFLTVYLLVQLVLPIRHHFIEGNVDWTGEGKKFAWRMKQPCKIPEEFVLNFGHPDPDVDIGFNFRLNQSQMAELLYYPEHIVQLRDFLLEQADPLIRDELVFIPKISASMNSRRAKQIYNNRRYNMMDVRDAYGKHNNWITDID